LNKIVKITITNHTGSRNRGCEALVFSKIKGFEKVLGGKVEFSLHSNDPAFDSWRLKAEANTIFSYPIFSPNHTRYYTLNRVAYKLAELLEKIMPSRLKGVAVRSFTEASKSDVIVASGGDIFTSDYNNLRKHLSYVVNSGNKKVYLCSHTIGPFSPEDEKYFVKASENIDLITVREKESFDYLRSLNISSRVVKTADVAFTLPTLVREEAEKYIATRFGVRPDAELVSLSVSQGIIKYSALDADSYYKEFSDFVDYLTGRGKTVLLIPHVIERNPDNNDLIACEEVLARVQMPENCRVISGEPSAVELKGVIGLGECLVGTRTHSTIASLSQCVPTVSIAYSRKAYGIMKDIFGDELGEQLTIPAKGLSSGDMIRAYELAVLNPPSLEVIQSIKDSAGNNFELLKELLP
jgi:colanic acid/amylovoran biosynthesis protein